MTEQSQKSGNLLDGYIANSRYLMVTHCCLGLVSAFIYWIRPGTFTPHLQKYMFFTDVTPVYKTVFAWGPYAISYFISNSLLAGRRSLLVFIFIAWAISVAIIVSGFYLNIFGIRKTVSPLLLSFESGAALVLGAWILHRAWAWRKVGRPGAKSEAAR